MPKPEQPEGTEQLAFEQQEFYLAKLLEIAEWNRDDPLQGNFIAEASDSVRFTMELTVEIRNLLKEIRDVLFDIKSDSGSIRVDTDIIQHHTEEIRER